MGLNHQAIQHVAALITGEGVANFCGVSDVVLMTHLMVDHDVDVDALLHDPVWAKMHMHLHGEVIGD